MSKFTVADADGSPIREFDDRAAAAEWCQRETDRIAPLPIRYARLPLRVEEGKDE